MNTFHNIFNNLILLFYLNQHIEILIIIDNIIQIGYDILRKMKETFVGINIFRIAFHCVQ